MTSNLPPLSYYGVSPTRGFLPSESPLTSFPNPYYSRWDELITKLPSLISSGTVGHEILKLPILSTADLSSEVERRRAYVVLSFLIQAYVWRGAEDGNPTEKVPPQLSEPFLAVCDDVGLKPALTYAGLCLWNWRKVQGGSVGGEGDDVFELDDLRSLASFTGTRAEDAFYQVPVVIEADGGHLLPALIEAAAAVERDDSEFVGKVLIDVAQTLTRLNGHLRKLYATLDVDTFFGRLRPLLAGGKGIKAKGLPNGMIFQRSDGTETAIKLVGGSAVQSSLFPFLDHLLGVEHVGHAAEILEESRSLMPAKHRQLLDDVAHLPTMRAFVSSNPSNETLTAAFNECMKQLRAWRGQHIAVVSKYAVQPARVLIAASQKNSVASEGSEGNKESKPTGGMGVLPFLQEVKRDSAGIHNGPS